MTAKGHPLSELSRTISNDEQSESKTGAPMKTEYMVMDMDGSLHSPQDFAYRQGMDEFQSIVEKEALKKRLTGGQPKYLDYARRIGMEWETYGNVGQMRFGEEA